MSKKLYLIIFLLMFGFVLSACQPDDIPTNGDYTYGQNALVDSVEFILMENFPLQAKAIVKGNLPDGCTELYEIIVERESDQFVLTITTRRPTGDVACTEVLVPFEETVDLDIEGLDAGTYTVVAQDEKAGFTLEVDNVLTDQNDGQKYSYGNTALVNSFTIFVQYSFPRQVSVTIGGNLPDGCTKIDEILTKRDGDTFIIEIITRRPTGDVACTMALVPFEETLDLEVEGLEAGTYKVRVQDFSTSDFTLDVHNVLPGEYDDDKFTYATKAKVEGLSINLMESFPVQVSVNLSGFVRDGCTEIHDIIAEREGDTFKIVIITRRPTGDIACTMAIVPFEEKVKLDIEGLSAGTYQVVAGELTETFTLDVDNAYP